MCAEGWGKKEDNHARRSFAAPVLREEKNAETKENDSKAKSDRVMVMPDTIVQERGEDEQENDSDDSARNHVHLFMN